jgi:hypothetical protein
MTRFELQPLVRSALRDVAAFLHRWRSSEAEGSPVQKPVRETVLSIERRLRWLLIDNPVATTDSTLGYCLRDGPGVIRGLNLCFPVAFVSACVPEAFLWTLRLVRWDSICSRNT